MEEGNVNFHERGAGKALIELSKAYEPKKAVREFLTNSLDARVPGTQEDIIVTLSPKDRRIVVSDNGVGMSYDKLASLPNSVGFSSKYGQLDMRGEKALGMLAFGSLGEAMHIITRPYDSKGSDFGYMNWEIDGERIRFEVDKIDAQEVDKKYHGAFKHGTRVIVNRVDPHIMDRVLSVPTLAEWFTRLYNPALRKGDVNIKVGRMDKKNSSMKMQTLVPIEYDSGSSSELMDGVVEVPIKNEGLPGRLEVLLFVNPQGNSDKVAVYSKDVLVYDSLAAIDEFRKSPVWGSGKVSGFVNDRFNRLILGREGIDRQMNAFKAWFGALRDIESRIRPIVEEKSKVGRRMEQDEKIKTVYETFSKIWNDLRRTDSNTTFVRSGSGEITPVVGVSPQEPGDERGGDSPGGGVGTGKSGPGLFKYSKDGQLERVKPRKGFPFVMPQPIDFPIHEGNLRSKLEETMGSPVIYLNALHADYKTRVDSRDNSVFLRYIIELMSNETAYYMIRDAERSGRMRAEPVEVASRALREAETMKFLALANLGIK